MPEKSDIFCWNFLRLPRVLLRMSSPQSEKVGRNYYDDNFQATLVTPSGKKIKVVISKDSNERPVMKITKK